MNIVTSHVYPPIPDRSCDWSAIDADTYDGAEDSRSPMGWGATEAEQPLPRCHRHPRKGCPGECQYILGRDECIIDVGLAMTEAESNQQRKGAG
jgi:hypothetical protein